MHKYSGWMQWLGKRLVVLQGRGRGFAPAGEFLSGGAQKGTQDALGDTCRGTHCALVRCAQATTASQGLDGSPVSQRCCGRSAQRTGTAMQHAQVKRHSASRARASVAHRKDVLLISGGCVSVAPQARSEFRRTAVGRRASLVTFLSRTRKSLGRRGELPTTVTKTTITT
jgi:hypothetical protein